MTTSGRFYHIGFDRDALGADPPSIALLSGDPERAQMIARTYLRDARVLSEHRGLNSYLGALPGGRPILSATSGMGAPSLSIVVNELVQAGIRQIIRVGTCGSIQAHVLPGSVVITRAALCRQGAANDIAPVEYPAAADPFLTVALVRAAREQGVDHHLGITASVDTFYEGQERSESANPHLLRSLRGITERDGVRHAVQDGRRVRLRGRVRLRRDRPAHRRRGDRARPEGRRRRERDPGRARRGRARGSLRQGCA